MVKWTREREIESEWGCSVSLCLNKCAETAIRVRKGCRGDSSSSAWVLLFSARIRLTLKIILSLIPPFVTGVKNRIYSLKAVLTTQSHSDDLPHQSCPQPILHLNSHCCFYQICLLCHFISVFTTLLKNINGPIAHKVSWGWGLMKVKSILSVCHQQTFQHTQGNPPSYVCAWFSMKVKINFVQYSVPVRRIKKFSKGTIRTHTTWYKVHLNRKPKRKWTGNLQALRNLNQKHFLSSRRWHSFHR